MKKGSTFLHSQTGRRVSKNNRMTSIFGSMFAGKGASPTAKSDAKSAANVDEDNDTDAYHHGENKSRLANNVNTEQDTMLSHTS